MLPDAGAHRRIGQLENHRRHAADEQRHGVLEDPPRYRIRRNEGRLARRLREVHGRPVRRLDEVAGKRVEERQDEHGHSLKMGNSRPEVYRLAASPYTPRCRCRISGLALISAAGLSCAMWPLFRM